MGFSFSPKRSYNCQLITISGGCGHGTELRFRDAPLAKTTADIIPVNILNNDLFNHKVYQVWTCKVKTSGKRLFII